MELSYMRIIKPFGLVCLLVFLNTVSSLDRETPRLTPELPEVVQS